MRRGISPLPVRRGASEASGAAQIGIFAGIIIASLGALASPAPIQVAGCGIVLAFIIRLLWRFGGPPIILLPVLFQWSEVAIFPLSTIWRQVPLNDLAILPADLESSALYGLLGIAMLAIGLRATAHVEGDRPFSQELEIEAKQRDFFEIARIGFSLMVTGYGCAMLSAVAGPARELFNNISNLKYAGLFILAYWCILRRSHLNVLFAVILFEVIFGMTGFFAEFKNSVLTLVVAAAAARPQLRINRVFALLAALILLLSVAIFWSAVKGNYRSFVNKGTGDQVVSVPFSDRLSYLGSAVASFGPNEAAKGFEALINRHGYIEYLAHTMRYVPAFSPHEDGALTQAVISHITMPRIIFPGKPPLPSDTEVMARYTGLPMAWDTSKVSISIGYLGELYIDFGYLGGLFGIFVIGAVAGLLYRSLRDYRACPPLIRAGLCLMAILPLAYFGTAYVKLVGAFVFSAAIALLFQRTAMGRFLALLSVTRSRAV